MSLHLSTSISSAVIHAFLISYLNMPPAQFPHIHCESSPIPSSGNIQKPLHNVPWYGNIISLFIPSMVLFCSLEEIDENIQHPGPLTTYVTPHNSSLSSIPLGLLSGFPEHHIFSSLRSFPLALHTVPLFILLTSQLKRHFLREVSRLLLHTLTA